MASNSYNSSSKEIDFNLKEEVMRFAKHWKWFVLSIFFFISFAVVHLRYAQVLYVSNVNVIFKTPIK